MVTKSVTLPSIDVGDNIFYVDDNFLLTDDNICRMTSTSALIKF